MDNCMSLEVLEEKLENIGDKITEVSQELKSLIRLATALLGAATISAGGNINTAVQELGRNYGDNNDAYANVRGKNQKPAKHSGQEEPDKRPR